MAEKGNDELLYAVADRQEVLEGVVEDNERRRAEEDRVIVMPVRGAEED